MAFIPVPNTVEVVLTWVLAGQIVKIIVHVERNTGSVNQADLESLAAAAEFWWDNLGKTHMSNQMSLVETSAKDLTTEGGAKIVNGVSPAIPGSSTDPVIANNVAFVITKRTAGTGRSRRGRSYLAGMPNSTKVDGVSMNPARVAEYLADYASLITNLETVSGNVFDFVVVQKNQNKSPLPTGITWSVTGVTADNDFDSQRRRLKGRGI